MEKLLRCEARLRRTHVNIKSFPEYRQYARVEYQALLKQYGAVRHTSRTNSMANHAYSMISRRHLQRCIPSLSVK